MQWSKSADNYAVIGANLVGPYKQRQVRNHPASGLPDILNILCPDRSRVSRDTHIQTHPNIQSEEFYIDCLDAMVKSDECKCNEAYQTDKFVINDMNVITEANNKIPSCPPTLQEARLDYRFILHDNCYIWAFPEVNGDGSSGPKQTFTRQCCYDTSDRYY